MLAKMPELAAQFLGCWLLACYLSSQLQFSRKEIELPSQEWAPKFSHIQVILAITFFFLFENAEESRGIMSTHPPFREGERLLLHIHMLDTA